MTTTFRLEPLSSDALQRARASGVDVSGNPVEHLSAAGGEPLRCCLRDAEPGESCILFGYEPQIPASPYREIGAVFAHADACAGPATTDTYPDAWRGRPQVLRAYDDRGWIHDSTQVHDGSDPESAIRAILENPEVERIHSRNVAHGCYMFTVLRRDGS